MDLGVLDATSLRILYDSMKESVIDVAAMDNAGVNEMKKFVYDHGQTGDLLRVNVSVNDKQFLAEAMFVEEGGSVDLTGNVFLPFDSGKAGVTVASSVLKFDDDVMTVDGHEVEFGSPFILGGRRVVLAKGSVVIILEDSLLRDFPEEGVQDEIINNDGTIAVGNVVTSGVSQLERKENSGDTSVVAYVFFHDQGTDERVCVAKRTHTVDFFETNGSSLIDLGNSDGNMEQVMGYDSSALQIRSLSTSGAESIATIDVNGLSFSSDESSVVFGSAAEFRIKYDDVSDTVQIQYLDGATYVTKREFGR